MGIITQFTSPHDVRWQGRHRIHHILFLVKNIVLVSFTILVIVEYALFKRWWDSGAYSYRTWEWAPYHFWLRIGMALVPDVALTLVSLILILNPMHHSTYSFHPVFALVSSFVIMALYVQVCWLNPLIALSNEVGFKHQTSWENIVLVETALECVICLLWIAMLVYSCMAVHKWRMAKKGGVIKMGTLAREERGLDARALNGEQRA